MDEGDVSHLLVPQLPHRLDEGHPLDVPDGPPHLDDADVAAALLCHPPDPLLDLVGYVGDDLDGLTQILAAPLLLDDALVNLPRGDVVVAGQLHVQEPLVVAQVQVHLPPVLEDEDLAVLEGAHQPRVDVYVGVDLDGSDIVAPLHQHPTDGGGGDPLSQAAHHPAGNDDVSHAYHVSGKGFRP